MQRSVQKYIAMGFDEPMAAYFAAGRRTLVKIIPHPDYSLELFFDNAERRRLDLSTWIQKGTAWEPLLKWENFKRVFLDECHAPAWDIDPNVDSNEYINNRLDICPDACYVDSVPYEENK